MLELGIRVIRGPDWKWGAQDDGEGHVGTVVELGKFGSLTTPDKTVIVQWDYGYRTNYRVGYQDGFDLQIVDNAPAGVKHPNIICDGCQKLGIVGMRWKCVSCYDYDLCTQCYMADHHDIDHVFQRFETAASIGVEMASRRGTPKVTLRGIFVGAKVVRGTDWDWGNQDGGEGKTGRVIDIRGWDHESSRSVANVTWTCGSTNVYRVGHKGKVDLKYIDAGDGGTYYRGHLPLLGQQADLAVNKASGSQRHLTFSVGDKVKVMMEVDALRHMQEGHGGWNQRMEEYIGQIGTVHRVTDRGDIRVQYEGCSHRWTFHPGSLTKVITFAVGDIVQVRSDVAHVREHQRGHGEWIDVMKKVLGKLGKVKQIYSDGDLRVNVDRETWTLNPLCVQLVPGSAAELNNTLMSDEEDKESDESLLPNLEETQDENPTMDTLIHESAEGNFAFVRNFFTKMPMLVNEISSGKTCLQVAAHQGHLELVDMLLNFGARFDVVDDVGDSPLHYAAFGDQPAVLELLLLKGANINAVNLSNCTTMHVAVNKQHLECVGMLLKFHCNINLQDSYGDTVLHDAIGKDSFEILELLCNTPRLDFTLCNKRGFNVLHHAALKGNLAAIEKLVTRTRQLVDVKKDDGFSALHLASLNGHRDIAECLLVRGQADINLTNNRRQTALHLALSQGRTGVVELLTSLGVNVACTDEDGDSPLHLAVSKMASFPSPTDNMPSELEAPDIYALLMHLHSHNSDLPAGLATACHLVQQGCPLQKKNHKDQAALDLLSENFPNFDEIAEILQGYDAVRQSVRPVLRPAVDCGVPMEEEPLLPPPQAAAPSTTPATMQQRAECSVCSESGNNVCFEPCGDRVACEECALRMKRCLACHQPITRKLTKDGRVIACQERQSSAERLKYLESKIAEIEETHCCSICMERRRNVVFLCGHGACERCAQTLKTCHMCRKTITKKINIY